MKILLDVVNVLVAVWICAAAWRVAALIVKVCIAKIKSDKIRQFILREITGFFAPAIALDRCVDKRSWNYVLQMRVICRYTYRKFRS